MQDDALKKLALELYDKHFPNCSSRDIAIILTEHDLRHMGLPGNEMDRAMTFLYQQP